MEQFEQMSIDFNNPALSHKENSIENQLSFLENIDHFSNQCKIVYKALARGERLTTTVALLKYGVEDLRRRIKDLKDMWLVPVLDERYKDPLTDKPTRFKEYYLPKHLTNQNG